MVPGPQSKSSFAPAVSTSTEQELRLSEGTQVPEPNMVTYISEVSDEFMDDLKV